MSVWDGEAPRAATPDATDDVSAQIDTVVVGGGQAGLAVGYHLARRAHDFVILEGGVTSRASRGATGGTRCGCSPPPGSATCRACASQGPARPCRPLRRHS